MRKICLSAIVLLIGVSASAHSQIKSTSIPIGDAVEKALKKSLLTGEDARPFHIKIVVSEPEN